MSCCLKKSKSEDENNYCALDSVACVGLGRKLFKDGRVIWSTKQPNDSCQLVTTDMHFGSGPVENKGLSINSRETIQIMM